MTIKTVSKKKKIIIILAAIVLVVSIAKFILYYTSTEQKMIRSYNNNNELYVKLIDDLSDYHNSLDDDVSRIEIGWDPEKEQSDTIMRKDLVHKVPIDENIYNDLKLALDTIDNSEKMYFKVFFDQDRVIRMEIHITDSSYRNGEDIVINTDELVYSVLPVENLNKDIAKSKPIDENWYFVKEEYSAG
ncbi:hypothetical protein [Ruminococcus albus]|uniref:Uncharacterized protein n=1 Tax=Ruminococcus albus (strain ATCC 27210 / DSM 20455 / JCM 14654 / NCDO 2250 / 7) TaxID=697329 RepID=E6UE04_RUMA7|nr:hypothetical protein [Ruminococcus albus]ADU22869.1 hypothetical protein Rumal_2389 [Ruminococcus albus 7 = DSM 20455]